MGGACAASGRELPTTLPMPRQALWLYRKHSVHHMTLEFSQEEQSIFNPVQSLISDSSFQVLDSPFSRMTDSTIYIPIRRKHVSIKTTL